MELVAARKAEIDNHENDLVAVLQEARNGLIPVPEQGAAWNAEARYIAGDKVEGGYVAIKYNRGKNPADYLGIYWQIETTEYENWTDITDGSVIAEGTIVRYDGKLWQCISQHIKSTVYKPKEGSSKWAEYNN